MMLFRVDTRTILPEYFAGVLNSRLIQSEIKRLTGGAASPHLNVRSTKSLPIPLPPIAEQREIVRRLGLLTAEIRRLTSMYRQKVTALEALKESLLHQAFTGRLTSRAA